MHFDTVANLQILCHFAYSVNTQFGMCHFAFLLKYAISHQKKLKTRVFITIVIGILLREKRQQNKNNKAIIKKCSQLILYRNSFVICLN